MQLDPDAMADRRWRPWLVAAGLWIAMAAVTAAGLWHLRREAVDAQSRELGLLSLALTDAIERGLRGADEGLQALRAERGDVPAEPREADPATPTTDTPPSLRTRAALMPLVTALWRVGADGRVVAASDSTPPPDTSSFFPPLAELDADAASLSRPFGDARGSGALVALAIRQPAVPGAAAGWLLAAMPSSTLLGAFGASLPAPDSRMWVVRGDGARLAGVNVLDSKLAEADVARRLAVDHGVAVRRLQDGRDHLVALQTVPRYGAKVLVARNMAAVLRAWREAADVAGAALAALLVVMAAAVHFVQLADGRRGQAQRALRDQVARAGKLESLGTLAGGVAHDFNNVLAGIVGYAEMAQDAAAAGSEQARHLDRLLRAAARGKALVERILAFSRGGARASTVFDLTPVVDEALAMLATSLRPGIVLEREFGEPGAAGHCVRGDPTQAFEAVMNLCTNALQAMPEGGMLSVRLARLRLAVPKVLSHTPLAAGEYVTLTVADQGRGISPEVMEHLFEPFFTTRAAQSGTGLGLAVVFGIVAEFGGAIDVTSRPGQGARFTLYFPARREAPEAVAPVAEPAVGGAGQRLLVVDDEPELVALAVEVLRGLGYEPVGCTDPVAALEMLRRDPRGFAAVVTDELMPVMSGTQLTQALRPQWPGLPVLLVSGHGGALLAQRALAAGVTRVLAKPLRRGDLAQALAEALR